MAPRTAAKRPAATIPEVEVVDCEQRSDEWFAARLGIPTASNFADVMAGGRSAGGESIGRRALLYKLAGEILTGQPAENYRNAAMQRGIDMEPDARQHYARTYFADMTEVGFIRRRLPSGRFVGCSPDSLVRDGGRPGALEIKTMAPHLLIDRAVRGTFPTEHLPQVQGIMWVADLAFVDLLLYYRGMPVAPLFKVERNEAFIRDISDAVEVFDYDLHVLVKRLLAMGGG